MSSGRSIRAKVLCVFRRGERILAIRGEDPATGEAFYRPFGGEIEFGERAEDAIVREIGEELGAPIDRLRLLGVLENRFAYGGEPGHEVAFVFDADFAGRDIEDGARVEGQGDAGERLAGEWIGLSAFGPGHPPLYPAGLLELLRDAGAGRPAGRPAADGGRPAHPLFAVIRSRGRAWRDGVPMERQEGWESHASFMDALEREGFVLLGGPLDGTPDVLLVVRAATRAAVLSRLAEDPWSSRGLLHVSRIEPWTLRLGALP